MPVMPKLTHNFTFSGGVINVVELYLNTDYSRGLMDLYTPAFDSSGLHPPYPRPDSCFRHPTPAILAAGATGMFDILRQSELSLHVSLLQ